jgi:transposase
MHVAKIVRRHHGRTYVSYLLRRSYRDGTQVKHQTLANLSPLPEPLIDLIRRSLQGETFVAATQTFAITQSRPHGHVHAVLGTIRSLGLESLLATRPSRQRHLVVALLAERLLFPSSKLAATRHWRSTTLAEELGVADANETEVYRALDWLGKKQAAIETQLASRHLTEQSLVLCDISSSFYYGRSCPLARHGHDRDGKKGRPIIVYGLLTDAVGRPIAIEVYPGNTADPTTVPDQVEKLRQRFGLTRIVLAGDRGLLTATQIETLRQYPGLGWISALRSEAIRALIDEGNLQTASFTEKNLAEISSPDFPGERLVACYNAVLGEERRRKRNELLQQTEAALTRLTHYVARRTEKPLRQTEIALRVGKRINRYKMAKHFELTIRDGYLAWARREESIRREEQLDGIYVIRTSEPSEELSAADGVRNYKRLTLVEQAFRSFKGVDLMVRPIYHRVEPRVRAHMFLCMLAYYVEWQMRRLWAPLLFEDEEREQARLERDPVAKAESSEAVERKKKTHVTESGLEIHSFRTLLAELGSQTRNTCTIRSDPSGASFQQVSEPTPLQAEAFRLLGL